MLSLSADSVHVHKVWNETGQDVEAGQVPGVSGASPFWIAGRPFF